MSPQYNAYKAYSQAFNTVSKTRQIVMLYDGMVRFMRQAKEAIEQNRIEERYNLLMKVSEIVMGLQGSLDFENGGNVAQALYDFYSSIDSKIMRIHRNNSLSECDEIIDEIKEMRVAWEEIDHSNSNNSTHNTVTTENIEQQSHIQADYGKINTSNTASQAEQNTATAFSNSITA